MNYVILGAGAWGTAVAIQLARRGQSVTLVPRRLEHALELAAKRENVDYLPGVPLDSNIQIASELLPALMEAEVALLACPMKGLRDLCAQIAEVREQAWALRWVVTLCKGLEPETLMRPSQIVAEALPQYTHAALSGPSFADEVAAGKPTAVTLAAEGDEAMGERIQEEISDTALRVYRSTDLCGVELAGCLKNIYAIGAGIADGLRLGQNTKAAYMTRALREMMSLGKALGGKPVTFFGLSGVGDLIATCSGQQSRNRSFGQAIAEGSTADALLEGRKTVVEGYWAAQSFYDLAQREGLEAPILEALYAVLYAGKPAGEAIASLMMRELKEEAS